MKTFLYLWQYLDEFLLEWGMFFTNTEEKKMLFNNFPPPRKSYRLWDNVQKYGTARCRKWQYGACSLRAV